MNKDFSPKKNGEKQNKSGKQTVVWLLETFLNYRRGPCSILYSSSNIQTSSLRYAGDGKNKLDSGTVWGSRREYP
jgi:hypothetical protein